MKQNIILTASLMFVLTLVLCVSSVMALDFTKSPNELTQYTQMHGLAYTNGFLYVVAGNSDIDGDSYKIEYASIDANGNIGPFAAPSSMFVPPPSNDSGAYPYSAYIENAAFGLNGKVYRLGGGWNSGNPGGDNNADSIWATQNIDGTLGPWSVLTPFPTGNLTGGLWTIGSYARVNGTTWVYAFGGQLDDSSLTNQVYRSRVDEATGALTAWDTTCAALPSPVYFNMCYVSNGHAYVWGGMTVYNTTASSHPYIWHATINGNGVITSWSQDTLPAAMQLYRGSGVAGSKHVVYQVGGRQYPNTAAQPYIFKATVNTDGSLGAFAEEGQFGVVGAPTTGLRYTPAVIAKTGNDERVVVAGFRGTVTSDLTLATNAFNVSKGAFISVPVYTMPSIAGGPIIVGNPGDTINLTVNNGTGPYAWVSSDTTLGTISGVSGSNATFNAALSTGSATVTVTDAYGDTADITIIISATSAPLATEVKE